MATGVSKGQVLWNVKTGLLTLKLLTFIFKRPVFFGWSNFVSVKRLPSPQFVIYQSTAEVWQVKGMVVKLLVGTISDTKRLTYCQNWMLLFSWKKSNQKFKATPASLLRWKTTLSSANSLRSNSAASSRFVFPLRGRSPAEACQRTQSVLLGWPIPTPL